MASKISTAIGCAAAAVALTAATLAVANGPDGAHPLDYTWTEYALLLAVAVLGGMVGWYGRLQSESPPKVSVLQVVGEVGTSAFAGLLAFWLTQWAGAPQLLSICIVGVAGHMGARFLYSMESWVRQRIGRL